MRTLRFSASLTVLFSALLPGVVGLFVGAAFFIYRIFLAMGADVSLDIPFAFQIWMLTAMHGLVMYAIPSLLLGIALIFFLDRGVAKKKFALISIVVALVMTAWAVGTVDFTGSIALIFGLSMVAVYVFLLWVTVPIEQRKTARLFDGLNKKS